MRGRRRSATTGEKSEAVAAEIRFEDCRNRRGTRGIQRARNREGEPPRRVNTEVAGPSLGIVFAGIDVGNGYPVGARGVRLVSVRRHECVQRRGEDRGAEE